MDNTETTARSAVEELSSTSSPLSGFMKKAVNLLNPEMKEKPAVKLEFTERRDCCGQLYGYQDQFGRNYNLDKVLLTGDQDE